MLKIGERINATRKTINDALQKKDVKFLQQEAIIQEKAGADYIDLNCGSGENEIQTMEWLVDIVQEVTSLPLCIDTPSVDVMLSGLKRCKNPSVAIANSIVYEQDRIEKLLPIVKEYDCFLICLLMDENGIPETDIGRLEVADKFVKLFDDYKITRDKIFFDPLVEPISLDTKKALVVLNTIKKLKEKYIDTKVIVSLSGISFGLPNRKLLNRSFISPLILYSCDAIILDVVDPDIISSIYAAEALFDKDEFCLNYINFSRNER